MKIKAKKEQPLPFFPFSIPSSKLFYFKNTTIKWSGTKMTRVKELKNGHYSKTDRNKMIKTATMLK